MQLLTLALIFSPILMGILIYAIDRDAFSRSLFVLQSGLTVLWALLLMRTLPALAAGEAVLFVAGGWSVRAGIEFRLDRVSLLFTLMTVLAFWYVYLYVWWSRRSDHKFFFFLSVLQGALLALFLVNDLFSMFVLIELISITCSILITYKKDGLSVKAGLYYLLYNSLAMLLFLLGLMMVYMQTGTVNLSLLAGALPEAAGAPAYRWAVVLILAAFCLKSALVPVYSWLPLAHASAPASVSALLSGLVVKSGLFILLRLGALLYVPGVQELLMALGLVSGLFGAFMAFAQIDIKRLLAYSTISHIGLIVFGLSSAAPAAEAGALLHIFNHFLFKSLLFLCAGTVITMTGERQIGKVKGLWRQCPALGGAMAIGILGITGAPLFNGSLSKAMIAAPYSGTWESAMLWLINGVTAAAFLKLATILAGKGAMPLHYPDRRVASPLMMAVLVVLSYPGELMLLNWLSSTAGLAVPGLNTLGADLLKYGLLTAVALWVYRVLYRPHGHRLLPLATGRSRFSRGVGVLVLFWAALSALLVW